MAIAGTRTSHLWNRQLSNTVRVSLGKFGYSLPLAARPEKRPAENIAEYYCRDLVQLPVAA
jgi:hypothetical protein